MKNHLQIERKPEILCIATKQTKIIKRITTKRKDADTIIRAPMSNFIKKKYTGNYRRRLYIIED